MYKRLVSNYVTDELRKGKTIDQIRKRLTKVGYNKKDLDEVLRTFEYRETDLKNREHRLEGIKTGLKIVFSIIFVLAIINVTFFFYYFSDSYDLFGGGIPTGMSVANTTKEEPHLEKDLNISNSSLEVANKENKQLEGLPFLN